ncbi:MAG: TonB-dependent receptor [Gammaproteobacteria bacterium]|nr:TonB-dependent receptor [Gammaproteobacteria bacterium]
MFPPSCFMRNAVVLSLSLVSLTAFADDSLEEIVVTADFRGRSSVDVPSSMTILDRETIELSAIQHFEELIYSIPNLNWSGDGNRARHFQIRGAGELEQYEGAPNPSVGFLIDDIDFSGIGSVATLFDIEQIEVLKGPQGSRYGANALAGLIYVQSVEPTDEQTGVLRLSAGGDAALSGGIAFGGPLTADGKFKYRLSAQRYESDGFRNNTYLGRSDTNGRRETTVRAKLLWQTDNDWTMRLTGMFTDINDGYDAFAIDNSLTVLSDRPGKDAQTSIGAAFKAVWEGSDSISLTSITSVADSDMNFSFDADWGNADAWAPFTYDFVSRNDRKRKTISQEIRVASAEGAGLLNDRVQWLGGLFIQSLDETLSTRNQGEYFDPFFDFALSLDTRLDSRFEARNAALFGQLSFSLGRKGTLSTGLRIENRSTEYSDSDGLSVDPGETMVGGEISYRHAIAEGINGYVTLAKGYKAGGFNLGLVPDGQRKFVQEALWSLELGIKSGWLDDRLVFNAAVFRNERRDQQVRTSAQLVPNDPASFVFFTANAAKGTTLGLEADVRWTPVDRWELSASVGLLNAEFDRFVTPDADLSGRNQAHAPAYSLAMGGMYRHPGGLFARVDWSARDEFYFDISHDQKSTPFELVNVRLGFETERWTAQIWARNLLDERYAVRGFFFGNEPPNFPNTLYIRQGDPRQLGVTFDMRF